MIIHIYNVILRTSECEHFCVHAEKRWNISYMYAYVYVCLFIDKINQFIVHEPLLILVLYHETKINLVCLYLCTA